MKVGDKLYCHTNKSLMNDISNSFDIGFSYEIVLIVDGRIIVRNKRFSVTHFGFDSSKYWYYNNWFYTIKELRNFKLKELKNVDTL